MTPEEKRQWREADEALDRLLDLAPDARPAALAALDPALRPLVERLLQGLEGGALDAPLDVEVPRSVGLWTLEAEIGRGGMAVVYRAHRVVQGTRQRAAVKIMTVGALAGDGRRRFDQEHAVLARLAHPRITPLIDAGVLDDGTPWLAMPLVEGIRIDDWCRSRQLDAASMVRLYLQVCDGVAHAHRHLVVHRDLKPGNLLVDADGHVHLLDFGIARLLDDAGAETTGTRGRALTPQYAAPEQFRGGDSGVGVDVFGLGAVLYLLLTGRPPRLPEEGHDTRITRPSRAAAEGEALPPELRIRFSRSLRGDLDLILLKALAHDPDDRYADVVELADDLRAWLDRRPVKAARPDRLYRARRFVARHRGGVAASLLIVAAVLAGLLGTVWQAQRAERAAAEAQREAARALQSEADARLSLARSEALREFLVGLFSASRPLRPQDAMPSTESLLSEGAGRVLRDIDADPVLRAEMLSAIGTVYLQRRMSDAAAPLVAAAVELADGIRGDASETWARVQLMAAQQAMLLREFERAEGLLAAIDDPVAELPAGHLLRLESRYERARIRVIQQQPDVAMPALLALREELAARTDATREFRLRVGNMLGWSLANASRHEQADEVYAEVIAAAATEYGEDHLNHAVHLANAGGNAMRLGAFARAEALLLRAIDIYDAIDSAAMAQRATARSLLGMLMLASGRHPQAEEATRMSRSEWAALQGRDEVEDDPVFQYRMAMIDIADERWEPAVTRLRRALELDWPAGASSTLAQIDVGILLAEAECMYGDASTGAPRTVDLRGGLRDLPGYDDPRWLAWLAHAEAACAAAEGDSEAALDHLAQATRLSSVLAPGFASEVARRELMEARLLQAAGRGDEAAAVAARGRARLRALDLETHPLLARLGAISP